MHFTPLHIGGAWTVNLECLADERGFFARAWCREEFAMKKISSDLVQANISFNHREGTLRGMHFQRHPHEEMKVVRCLQGAIFDVTLDLRPDSPTFCQWHGEELSASSRRMLIVPEGCAHGFQTLEPNTEVFYQVSKTYAPQSEIGVRWDDPKFGIEWPMPIGDISRKDSNFPDFDLEILK